ncbi:CU044_5270 family protein [Streptosporangium sp. NPDC049376]|uniref:CU044_5270 family protein n=1 Tax=Streptosporangium sp. NPDC049376 TaxID=3366192 RepID=UPI0037B8D767
MDDLKLLNGMRADAPEPGADRLNALRARVLRPRRRFRLVPSLLVTVSAAAGAVAVAVVVNGAVPPPQEARPSVAVETRPMNAAVVLVRAAQVSERRALTPEPRADQWLYRKNMVKQPNDAAPETQESWIRYDGTRRAVRWGRGPLEQFGSTPDPDDDDLTPREYAARLAGLPTDPDRLLAHVRGDRHWETKPRWDTGEPPDARAFRVLSVYLDQEVPVPPRLRGAIFRALARIPGVRVDSGVRDAAGRAGIGIAYERGAPGVGTEHDTDGQVISRSYLVLDATTYEFLGTRVDYVRDELINGEIAFPAGSFYATAELAKGIVGKPGELPGS